MSMDADTAYREGIRLYEQRRFEDSLAAFGRVAQAAPGRAEAHYGVGRALLSLDRLDEAEESFREALKRNARDPNSHYQLGVIAERRGDRSSAIRAYLEAVAIDSSHAARDRLHALSPAALNDSRQQHPSSGGMGDGTAKTVLPSQLAFSPAEIGTVTKFNRRSESDPNQPLVTTFQRPTVQIVTFELAREGQPPLAVEMRGSTLEGPLGDGDRVAIPAKPDKNGLYRTDRVQLLSALPDRVVLVVMKPLVDQPTMSLLAWGARLRALVPFLTAAFVIAGVLIFVLVLLPDIRQTERDMEAEQQRWEQQLEADERRFEREQRKEEREAERKGMEAEEAFEREARQAQQRFEQEAQQNCLEAGFDESVCNMDSP